jgi:hypothetical protein
MSDHDDKAKREAAFEAFVHQLAEQIDREEIGSGKVLKLRNGRRIAPEFATPAHFEEARLLKEEEDLRDREAARKRLQDEMERSGG